MTGCGSWPSSRFRSCRSVCGSSCRAHRAQKYTERMVTPRDYRSRASCRYRDRYLLLLSGFCQYQSGFFHVSAGLPSYTRVATNLSMCCYCWPHHSSTGWSSHSRSVGYVSSFLKNANERAAAIDALCSSYRSRNGCFGHSSYH